MEKRTLQVLPDLEEEDYEEEYSGFELRKIKRWIIVGAIVVAIVYLVSLFLKYDGFDVISSTERSNSSHTNYEKFGDNLLKYSTDGVFYTDYEDKLIWNDTYEMTKPRIDINEGYLLIYDVGGSAARIYTTTGYVSELKASMPIVDMKIAAKGTVAMLLREEDTSFLQLYSSQGVLLAGGELHAGTSGFPVSIGLSSDAKTLMVSMISVADGNIKTVISFYNFGNAGKDAVDNLVASYSYPNMIIPKVGFVSGDKAIAFGDGEIVVFNNNDKRTVEKEIFPKNEMKSIFYNKKYFGYVTSDVNKNGEAINKMNVYNMYGLKVASVAVDAAYSKIDINDKNQIMFSDGENVTIYTKQGIKRFEYTFDKEVYKVIPGSTSRRYIIIEETANQQIRIK